MSIIGLFEFLGGAVILCGVTCFAYQWFKHTFNPEDDLFLRLLFAFYAAIIGMCALLLSVMVLMIFLSMVFPATVQ